MASLLAERLARRRAELERLPLLEASLLGGSLARYLGVRAFPVVLNRLFGYALHVVEAIALSLFVDGPLLARSLVVATLCRLVVGMHWSASEVLRSELRGLPSRGAVLRTQNAWLTLATILAVALFIVGGIAVHFAFEGGPREGVAELYALAYVARTALDLVVRTYHSGAYAFGRIYRPFWSIWGPQLVVFSVLIVSAYALGAAGLVLSLAISLPMRWLTVHYAARALRAHRRPLPHPSIRSLLRYRFAWRSVLLAAVGGLFAKAGLLAVLFVAVDARDPRRVAIGYFLAPIVGAAAAGVQQFYPDLKRLDGPLLRLAMLRFVRGLLALSAVLAVLWLAIGWAVFLLLLEPLFPIPLLVPLQLSLLTLVVATLGVVQLALLVRRQFGSLVLHGLLLLAALLGTLHVGVVVIALLASLLVAAWRILVELPGDPLPLSLQGAARLVTYELELLPQGRPRRRALADRIGRALPEALCWIAQRRLMVLCDAAAPALQPRLVVLTGGLARAIRRSEPFAAQELAQRLRRLSTPTEPLATLLERARLVVAETEVIDLVQPQASVLPSVTLAALWREGVARANGRVLRVQRDVHVAPVLTGSSLRALLVIPRQTSAEQVRLWRRVVGGEA